jgi:hypothetical protein
VERPEVSVGSFRLFLFLSLLLNRLDPGTLKDYKPIDMRFLRFIDAAIFDRFVQIAASKIGNLKHRKIIKGAR